MRISGPQACEVLGALGGSPPAHRSSKLVKLLTPAGDVIDQALVLYFEQGGSFTGEHVIELQLHGSIAVISLILRTLGDIGLSRVAEPGEFTRRALMNGRLDLTQVQGLADVIEAETEEQHRQAMRVFDGELSRRVTSWRDDLIRAAALIEAVIDFADEDVPENVVPEITMLVDRVRQSIRNEISGVEAAARIRTGLTVAIVGEPNSGKSTLLNALTRSDASIVSDLAGTTRDVIEVRMNIGGLVVTLVDTAGLRSTEDRIELLGIERAMSRAKLADLRIFLYEGPVRPVWPVEVKDQDIVTRTKIDLEKGIDGISAKTGGGIDDLIFELGSRLKESTGNASLVSQERDRMSLEKSLKALNETVRQIEHSDEEIIAFEIRSAMQQLEVIIGGVDIETILDEVFSSFCLGK